MKTRIVINLPIILCLTPILIFAQYNPVFVTNTNSYDATALNNSHKIAITATMGNDQYIVIVYRSSDTIYTIRSTNSGSSWQPREMVDCGGDCRYPAIDLDKLNRRHLVWRKQVFDNYEIMYDCLDDTFPPINVSNSMATPWSSTYPDLVVDTNFVIHITWTERVNPLVDDRIYYRSYYNGILQDTVQLSDSRKDFGSSISIFNPNNRLYVVWFRFTSGHYTVCMRYKESAWSNLDSLASGPRVLRNPSLDYSHANDVFSACFEDSTGGNLDARFYGGNGGWGNTPGYSQFPVLSTVGTSYSYIFWMEDSNDIYYQTYYFMHGWSGIRSLRTDFSISEPVRYPSTCGSSLIWIQGNSAPYKIYYMSFGYPIGIEDQTGSNVSASDLLVNPNPANEYINITYNLVEPSKVKIILFNSAGVIIKKTQKKNGTAGFHEERINILDLPNGVYFYQIIKNEGVSDMRKIVLIK